MPKIGDVALDARVDCSPSDGPELLRRGRSARSGRRGGGINTLSMSSGLGKLAALLSAIAGARYGA